ncbi:unnamed protein product, partial [Choristocarpus tenellus]
MMVVGPRFDGEGGTPSSGTHHTNLISCAASGAVTNAIQASTSQLQKISLPDSEKGWKGPGKSRTVVNGLTFRSDFDSGNLMKVTRDEGQGAGFGGLYHLWTARDCEGGPNTKRNSSWFHFGVAGGERDDTITMRLMNLNNQLCLYKNGMTPVYRQASSSYWTRLKQKVVYEEFGRHLQLQFHYRFLRAEEEVFFAFCFPYSYEACLDDLHLGEEKARKDGMAVQPLLTPKAGPTVYYHRELLTRSTQGRRVDLITVTDCNGVMEDREPRIDPHIFPQHSKPRPFEFSGKDVVFVSARVHPGETPSSYVFQGILRFLLNITDPRAAELRRRYVFKLVPLLNPDGVAAGHFRQDTNGNNLNRHYIDPDPVEHAPIFAAKSVVMHHAERPKGTGRLSAYLDLHAHASTRGCFIYGNHLCGLEEQ